MIEALTSKRKNIFFWGIVLIGVYSILPFLCLTIYNQPAADDYLFANRDLNNSFLKKMHDYYFTWSGRYFSTAISEINPLNFYSVSAYKIYSFVIILLFFCSVLLLVYQLFKKYISFKTIVSISIVLIFLCLVQMPSISQGFFWFSGYACYQFPNILTIAIIAMMLQYNEAKNATSKVTLLICSVILCIAVIGSNELSLIILLSFIGFQCLIVRLSKKRPSWYLLILLLVCLATSIIEISAPGNYWRLAAGEPISLLRGAVGGIALAAFNLITWSPTLLVVTLFYTCFIGVPLANKVREQGGKYAVSIKLSLLYYIIIFLVLNVFYVLVGGSNLPNRCTNVMYLFFLMGWLFNVHLFLVQNANQCVFPFSSTSKAIGLAVGFLFVFYVIDVNNNISTAYLDLLSGKAKKYDHELFAREKIIAANKADSCIVPALTAIPKSIFFVDIDALQNTTPLSWNKIYAEYRGQKYVFTDTLIANPQSNLETIRSIGKTIFQKK